MWIQFKIRQKKKDNVSLYVIPFLNIYHRSSDELTDLLPENLSLLHEKKQFLNGVYLLLLYSDDYLGDIKHHSFSTGAA